MCIRDSSNRGYEQESWMLTGDLKIAEVKWVVQYKIKDAKDYLFNVKNVENTIFDVSEAAVRLMIGDRSFIEVLQAERESVAIEARKYMQELLDSYKCGVSIQLVQLQGVVPPEPVADSFNEVNRAKQEQETLINEAKQAYNQKIFLVEGQAEKIITEALALEKAGASMLLLECVPGDLAQHITKELNIPVIGIGAGVHTDGQIMVIHDLLGISCLKKPPKFVKNFMKDSSSIQDAIKKYVMDVKNHKYPSKEHTFN